MLEALERLLILQDRDIRVGQLRMELASLDPQREIVRGKSRDAEAAVQAARDRLLHLESDRKRLELEVEAKKQQIEKYSLQQFQTKKNEEYRALSKEIEGAQKAITSIEDEELTLMERGESQEKELRTLKTAFEEAKSTAQGRLADLDGRESSLKQQLEELETDRQSLAEQVDPPVLARYERLRQSKGERVVVGVNHGVCGGCHMKLPAQEVVSCRSDQEIVNCPNCGRILYYTEGMSLVSADE